MKYYLWLLCFVVVTKGFAAESNKVFEEQDGLVVVEAEHFVKQEKDSIRKWYVVSDKQQPDVTPDGDDPHFETASGNAYLEILPDTRRSHDDTLIRGENFTNEPGEIAVLSYQVHINNPGKYYVWVRAHSTNSEDNGIHVGIDGTWPESGRRMQWCADKNMWRWDSKQRTEEVHCGVPYLIYLDIKEKGLHTITFSMREDGFEFDQWILTLDREAKYLHDAVPASNPVQ